MIVMNDLENFRKTIQQTEKEALTYVNTDVKS